MRLGVIGHQGYDELPEILRTLFSLAPTLGIEAFLEQGLHDVAGKGARLEESAQLDGLVTLGGDGTLLRGARFLDGTFHLLILFVVVVVTNSVCVIVCLEILEVNCPWRITANLKYSVISRF